MPLQVGWFSRYQQDWLCLERQFRILNLCLWNKIKISFSMYQFIWSLRYYFTKLWIPIAWCMFEGYSICFLYFLVGCLAFIVVEVKQRYTNAYITQKCFNSFIVFIALPCYLKVGVFPCPEVHWDAKNTTQLFSKIIVDFKDNQNMQVHEPALCHFVLLVSTQLVTFSIEIIIISMLTAESIYVIYFISNLFPFELLGYLLWGFHPIFFNFWMNHIEVFSFFLPPPFYALINFCLTSPKYDVMQSGNSIQ